MTHRHFYRIEAADNAEAGWRLGKLFGEEIGEDLDYLRDGSGWKKKVAAARPLLQLTERHFPQYVEELRGYAEAARLPLSELWALAIEDELEEQASEKCTTVVTNDGALVAHNEDWDEDAIEAVCLLQKTIGELTVFEIYYPAVPLGGCALAVNSNGYLLAINSLPPMPRRNGLPKNVIARFLSETGDPAGDFGKVRQLPRTSGYNHIFVAPHGDVVDIECTPELDAVAQPELPFAHTNHFLSPQLRAFNGHRPGKSTLRRHASACRLARPYMSVEQLQKLSGDTADGRKNSILNKNTIARIVVDLPGRTATAWLRREKKAGWIDYPLDFIDG